VAARGVHERGDPRRRLGEPVGHGDQHPTARRVACEVVEELRGAGIGPVHVVQDQRESRRLGHVVDQLAQRPVEPQAHDPAAVGGLPHAVGG
jgi:hypothetical protein